MIRTLTAAAMTLAAITTAGATAKNDRACIRDVKEMFGITAAKRICNPKNYVTNPNEYGWECPWADWYPRSGQGSRRQA